MLEFQLNHLLEVLRKNILDHKIQKNLYIDDLIKTIYNL